MPPDGKKDVKEEKPSMSFKEILTVLFYTFSVILTLIIALFVAFINPETAKNFLTFLYGIEIFFGVYLFFLLFNLIGYIRKFKDQTDQIGKIYETKYVPKKDTSIKLTPIERRFNKAKEHIYSQFKEEWKIGIIELDTILKDLLQAKGYNGDTVGELLQSAEKKGLGSLNAAWEAHKVRNRIVHEGINFDMTGDIAQKAFKSYSAVFNELGING